MKVSALLIAAVCLVLGPAIAQALATASQQPPPAQHQPAVPAQPARPSAPPAPAGAPPSLAAKADPAKEASIRHLMEITQTSKLGENINAYITNQVHTVMGRAIQPDRLGAFMDAFNKKFNAAAPSSAVTDAMVPIYASSFSQEDIDGLVKFYESPLGQRVVKTLPEVEQKSQQAGLQIEQQAVMTVLSSMVDQYPELKPMLQPPPQPGAPPAPGASAAPAPAPTPKLAPSAPAK